MGQDGGFCEQSEVAKKMKEEVFIGRCGYKVKAEIYYDGVNLSTRTVHGKRQIFLDWCVLKKIVEYLEKEGEI